MLDALDRSLIHQEFSIESLNPFLEIVFLLEPISLYESKVFELIHNGRLQAAGGVKAVPKTAQPLRVIHHHAFPALF